jgi:hypothetical protein
VPTPTPYLIAAEFSDAMSLLTEDQLLVLMDDYKAMLRNAAVAGQKDVFGWLEDRIARITDAYGALQVQPPLPF